MKLQWKKRKRVWNWIGKGIHRLVVRISPQLGSILLFAMLGYMLFEFSCQPVYVAGLCSQRYVGSSKGHY